MPRLRSDAAERLVRVQAGTADSPRHALASLHLENAECLDFFIKKKEGGVPPGPLPSLWAAFKQHAEPPAMLATPALPVSDTATHSRLLTNFLVPKTAQETLLPGQGHF